MGNSVCGCNNRENQKEMNVYNKFLKFFFNQMMHHDYIAPFTEKLEKSKIIKNNETISKNTNIINHKKNLENNNLIMNDKEIYQIFYINKIKLIQKFFFNFYIKKKILQRRQISFDSTITREKVNLCLNILF